MSCVCFSAIYSVNISRTLRQPDTEVNILNTDEGNRLVLSKNQKNVVVITVDKAMGGYLPYILDEKPELAQQFSGFTFYPNTLSYGIATNWGAPGLYGGHEYSPTELNKRAEETLVDKHDESLSVMPGIFAENGYSVSVVRPVLAGYNDPDKAAALYDFDERIQEYSFDDSVVMDYFLQYGGSNEAAKKYNLFYYCLFRALPVCVRPTIYNDGTYLQTKQVKYGEGFLNNYAQLDALSELTAVSETENGIFLMFYNALPHSPAQLDSPDYAPTNSDINSQPQEDKIVDGKTMKMDTVNRQYTYDSNVATYILIGEWLDYLKSEGIYDNTRIIITSDHGAVLNGQIEGSLISGESGDMDIEGLNCLLMVKDFNGTGDLEYSEQFMMNADVPGLAVEGVVDHAVNPFTGKEIEVNSYPDEVTVTYNGSWRLNLEETTFETENSLWKVKPGDIYDKENWKQVN